MNNISLYHLIIGQTAMGVLAITKYLKSLVPSLAHSGNLHGPSGSNDIHLNNNFVLTGTTQ